MSLWSAFKGGVITFEQKRDDFVRQSMSKQPEEFFTYVRNTEPWNSLFFSTMSPPVLSNNATSGGFIWDVERTLENNSDYFKNANFEFQILLTWMFQEKTHTSAKDAFIRLSALNEMTDTLSVSAVFQCLEFIVYVNRYTFNATTTVFQTKYDSLSKFPNNVKLSFSHIFELLLEEHVEEGGGMDSQLLPENSPVKGELEEQYKQSQLEDQEQEAKRKAKFAERRSPRRLVERQEAMTPKRQTDQYHKMKHKILLDDD